MTSVLRAVGLKALWRCTLVFAGCSAQPARPSFDLRKPAAVLLGMGCRAVAGTRTAWRRAAGAAGLIAAGVLSASGPQAQPLTSQGPTGIGLVPTAQVQRPGAFTVDYSNAMPGAPDPKGHNFLLGMGLTEWLEVNMRLATNTVQCDFYSEPCVGPQIRDLSGSFKLQVPVPAPRHWGLSAAVGAVDVGGAASFFTSHYAVLTRSWSDAELSVGMARGQTPTSPLEGPMAAFTVHPWKPLTLSVQQVHGLRTAHALLAVPLAGTGVSAYLGAHRVLSDSPRAPNHPGQWAQLGLSVPLGGRVGERSQPGVDFGDETRRVQPLGLADVASALERQRLGRAVQRRLADGSLAVAIENTHYPRDVLDALGVALGVLAGLPAAEVPFVLVEVSQRGLPLVQARAPVPCLKAWLENGEPCAELELAALAHRKPLLARAAPRPWWHLAGRPELVLSPLITSTIGTEVGAFDADFGINANLVAPLWKGASFDYAYNFQLEQPTKAFRTGGLFADSRLREGKVRHMFHQVVELPALNTYLRASVGTGYAVFEGRHFESLSTSPDGRHRLTLSGGQFLGPYELHPIFKLPLLDVPRERQYRLARYRYAWDGRSRVTTEVTAGKFFNGDEGVSVLTRFHHGDASYAAYIRRSKMADRDQPVAFAGFQFSLALTPRRSVGPALFSLRGTTEFQYSIESKVGERDNLITRSYGEVPLFGEHLSRLLNRDRNGQAYLETTRWRLRDAFIHLSRD
ncbi:MAG: hypothetical protein EBV28_09885 [Betaproteobacteria bacterium]|nr:hypothetical protein [Betaproteobacteria bacterium]